MTHHNETPEWDLGRAAGEVASIDFDNGMYYTVVHSGRYGFSLRRNGVHIQHFETVEDAKNHATVTAIDIDTMS